MQPKNVGTVDRIVRVVVGIGLMGAAFVGALGPWAWIGVVPLVSGYLGTCPLYRVFGLKTRGLARE